MRHIILCLNCISTTTSCDRGEDFRPYRRRLPARSRGCRRSWNASRQDRPEGTYEVQITPARRVGTRAGVQPSPLRAIALRTIHLPQHHCRRPPAIPRRRGITRAVEDPPREVRVQIGDKGAQPPFTEPHEPRNHTVLSSALSTCNRLCHRFGHSPPFQGPLHVRNRMGDRIRQRHCCRTHPDQDGTLHAAPPTRPARWPTFCCRGGPT